MAVDFSTQLQKRNHHFYISFHFSLIAPELQLWVQENKLHSLAYASLSDGESYVRATCISALSHLLNMDDLWSNFLSTVEKSQVSFKFISLFIKVAE